MCNYSDVNIVIKGRIDVTANDAANRRNKKLIFKNDVPSRLCISNINRTITDYAEDLDIVIPMYNMLNLAKIILLLQYVCGIITEMG